MHYYDGWWHMGWMWLFWILVLALIVWIVVRVAGSQGSTRAQDRRPSPEEELKRRYARGEIERQEYEEKLEDLRR